MASTQSQWSKGKAEIVDILRAEAKRRGMITYSDLSNKLLSITITAHEPAMAGILGEISKDEDANGRGMLSAIVVHKTDDWEPGDGFYTCAEELGRPVADRTKFWVGELHKVHDYWANKQP